MGLGLSNPLSGNTYRECIDRLFARTTGAIRPGLERTLALLDALGNPHLSIPILHVAGTNGKGSVVALLASALEWQGYRVGTYTSPHLVDFRERIVADRSAVDADTVTRFLVTHEGLIEETGATFFEVTTALAFHWLRETEVDVAVVEVGLGGRLDSTNVVTPLAAGVVSVDIDHVDYLGGSVSSIAREKGGIFKPGIPAVHGAVSKAAGVALEQAARAAGASILVDAMQLYRPRDVRVDALGTAFVIDSGQHVRIPLAGEHQAWNAVVAMAMLGAAGPEYELAAEDATRAFAEASLPGRFQRTSDAGLPAGFQGGAMDGGGGGAGRGGEWVFDVAHNPAGIAALVQTMAHAQLRGPVSAVLSVLDDKDWRAMLRIIAPHVDRLVLTVAPSAQGRAWDLSAVCAWVAEQGVHAKCEPDFDRALALAAAVGADSDAGAGAVLVTGSFHTVGDAMVRLQVDPLLR